MFIGRERELESLKRLWKKEVSSLVVIKGRRRVGKSRLIQEFAQGCRTISLSGLPPDPKITAQDQRDEFARQLGRAFQIPIPYSQDWGDLFWHLAHHTQEGTVIVSLDEISWMGMKDATFLGKLKIAWDERFKKNPRLILILCGSVSSWIEDNILSHTGFVGRIDLVLALEELGLPECNAFWGKYGDTISAYEKFKVLSITGGIPRYLENIVPSLPAEEWIREQCFSPEGFLFREFNQLFHDLFSKKNRSYRKILNYLAQNPRASLEEISQGIQRKKGGVLNHYLKELIAAGFLNKASTWDIKTAKSSIFSRYRISDNYVRFYLKHIEPNREAILRKTFQNHALGLSSHWESLMGLQFENLVLHNSKQIFSKLGLHPSEVICEGAYFQHETAQRRGCQIDYLIQTKYNTLYLCEIKFSKKPIPFEIIREVQDKIERLDCRKNFSIRPVLIHVNGADESVVAESFFANLIDFGSLLL